MSDTRRLVWAVWGLALAVVLAAAILRDPGRMTWVQAQVCATEEPGSYYDRALRCPAR